MSSFLSILSLSRSLDGFLLPALTTFCSRSCVLGQQETGCRERQAQAGADRAVLRPRRGEEEADRGDGDQRDGEEDGGGPAAGDRKGCRLQAEDRCHQQAGTLLLSLELFATV